MESMRSHDFEHLPARSLDGQIPRAQQSTCKSDLALQELFAALPPLPPIRWNALAERISAAISRRPPNQQR
jgi:hypothetical protein